MTPIEIVAIIFISIVALVMLTIWIQLIVNEIKIRKTEKEIKNITNEIFKNIDNDMKELKRTEFFEDLEKIKNENKEEK